MTKENQISAFQPLVNRIYIIRDQKVMLDSDLAEIYGVETRRLNEQVKRNIDRFSELFMFQLTDEEYENLRFQMGTSSGDEFLKSQNVTLEKPGLRSQNATLEKSDLKSQIATSSWGGRRTNPYVFTEHGAIMLASVLKSETAVQASIRIVQAFVEMRKYISANSQLFLRMDTLEQKILRTDEKVDMVYKALEDNSIKPKQGIFFDGQVFDAYTFVSDLVRSAKISIVLIDNYIDDSILTLLIKRKKGVSATIFTSKISKQLLLDVKKHNVQYAPVELKELKNAHDRFMIIDQSELYHFGASLKDLGKKWFAFSKMETGAIEMLGKLNAKGKKDE
ncbi:MAG: DNA-binding protein [Bacteroidetes bacterium GWF2_41_31]|nr:MAG: DNA-binding protein [Bacteroidetes bacterium GWF2_41_31]OFZ10224.1 MAG: DNA-binding protein [Bacteroidetes bacterium RIFOXYB12_FULL_41_6]